MDVLRTGSLLETVELIPWTKSSRVRIPARQAVIANIDTKYRLVFRALRVRAGPAGFLPLRRAAAPHGGTFDGLPLRYGLIEGQSPSPWGALAALPEPSLAGRLSRAW